MKRVLFVGMICCGSIVIFGQGKPRESLDPVAFEIWDKEPRKVVPGNSDHLPPSDALILFDGRDLSQWTTTSSNATAEWLIKDGSMTVTKGSASMKTRKQFGDVQLHVEWRTPGEVKGEGQGRGNSGVYLQERYEIQVLDSYENRTYSNGQAGAIYKQAIPMVNASRKPGEWQTYDIIFTAPRFSEQGTLIIPAYMTVFQNGILIHNHFALQGTIQNQGMPIYESHGKAPILLQEHGAPVSYRNIWVREL